MDTEVYLDELYFDEKLKQVIKFVLKNFWTLLKLRNWAEIEFWSRNVKGDELDTLV